jgi:hypothetical protein
VDFDFSNLDVVPFFSGITKNRREPPATSSFLLRALNPGTGNALATVNPSSLASVNVHATKPSRKGVDTFPALCNCKRAMQTVSNHSGPWRGNLQSSQLRSELGLYCASPGAFS